MTPKSGPIGVLVHTMGVVDEICIYGESSFNWSVLLNLCLYFLCRMKKSANLGCVRVCEQRRIQVTL